MPKRGRSRTGSNDPRKRARTHAPIAPRKRSPPTKLFDTDDWIFQQDGATCHTSNSTTAFLAKKGLNVLGNRANPWPPNSPDLNLIENLWAILNHTVYHDWEGGSILKLKKAVGKAWRNIDREVLQNLVKGMLGRIAEVIKREGGALDR